MAQPIKYGLFKFIKFENLKGELMKRMANGHPSINRAVSKVYPKT